MKYKGSCHCGHTAFEVEGELEAVGDCNCSICHKSGFLHWVVDPSQVRHVTPEDNLKTYIWGTGVARHYYCPKCSVATLRVPRANPSKMSVNARCLEGVDLAKLTYRPFDGRATPLAQDNR